jgi:hypothetical protein
MLTRALPDSGQPVIRTRHRQIRSDVIEVQVLEQLQSDHPENVSVLEHRHRIPAPAPLQYRQGGAGKCHDDTLPTGEKPAHNALAWLVGEATRKYPVYIPFKDSRH